MYAVKCEYKIEEERNKCESEIETTERRRRRNIDSNNHKWPQSKSRISNEVYLCKCMAKHKNAK